MCRAVIYEHTLTDQFTLCTRLFFSEWDGSGQEATDEQQSNIPPVIARELDVPDDDPEPLVIFDEPLYVQGRFYFYVEVWFIISMRTFHTLSSLLYFCRCHC